MVSFGKAQRSVLLLLATILATGFVGVGAAVRDPAPAIVLLRQGA